MNNDQTFIKVAIVISVFLLVANLVYWDPVGLIVNVACIGGMIGLYKSTQKQT